jgi:hypothetical protein
MSADVGAADAHPHPGANQREYKGNGAGDDGDENRARQ